MKVSELIKYTNGKLVNGENIDIESFSFDSTKISKNTFFIPLIGEKNDGHNFIETAFKNGAIGTFTIKDINYPKDKVIIKVSDTLISLQQLALQIRKANIEKPVIAITGSVGKTSTKNMISSILKKNFSVLNTMGNFNNHIGLPITIANYKNEDIIVLEMGMNHLGEISFLSNIAKPDIAVITNIGHSHLGNLGSRENILKAKLEILESMKEKGILVINNDNDLLHNFNLENNINQKIITFGINNKSDFMAYDIEVLEDLTKFKVDYQENTYQFTIKLSGKEFVYNALASIAIGLLCNVTPAQIISGLLDVNKEKMRMNKFIYKGATIIDDTYNASPESINAGLQALIKLNGKRKIAVLADILELGEFSKKIHYKVGCDICKFNLDYLVLMGDEAQNIGLGAKATGMDENNIIYLKNTNEVSNWLKNMLKEKDNVLVKGSRGMKLDEVIETFKIS